jgi:hypothetical protein
MSGILSCRRVCTLFSICTALCLGCGNKGDDIPDTVPVSGKVTVDGQPVTEGQVSFIPFDKEQKTGALITGKIDPSGGYVMYTGGKTGVPPGRYKATVTPVMVPTGGNKMPAVTFNTMYTDASKTKLIVNVAANTPASEYELKLTK